jgi:hypothetical protein
MARIHEKVKKHLCSHCGNRFFSVSELRIHIKNIHPDQVIEDVANIEDKLRQLTTCNVCGKSVKDLTALKSHKTRVHVINQKKRNYEIGPIHGRLKKCLKCKVSFDNVDDFNRHVFDCTKESKGFPCNRCNTKWNNAGVLNRY